MAGRRPKPTQAKVLQGTFRPDRSNPNEPKPPRGHVSAPDWLKGEARWAWEQLAKQLGEDGTRVLSKQDRHALGMLCDAYREYRVARRRVEQEGMMIVSASKYGPVMVKHPLIQVYQDAWRRVRLMLIEFGLTPAARSKTSSQEPKTSDPLKDLLNRNAATR